MMRWSELAGNAVLFTHAAKVMLDPGTSMTGAETYAVLPFKATADPDRPGVQTAPPESVADAPEIESTAAVPDPSSNRQCAIAPLGSVDGWATVTVTPTGTEVVDAPSVSRATAVME